ncbi:Ankyrin repeat protein [Penicillium cosmopolitanum]|uniref:Ankyrin repeat protein n=1 Tax=Penicillium cosmopolitanum TaxID=1131564 RepID=A0A9W9W5I2_9EURO|nr:Ankyrin repeat protein [Penicillium cosmopolitanum]KAJ5403894.1 Ankyrin repeat protein [Penicillium cosmopolitanum]
MSILLLPNELLMLIAYQLECKDLNALIQTNLSLYRRLNRYLYYWNVGRNGFSGLVWAAKVGSVSTLQWFLAVGAGLDLESSYWAFTKRSLPGSSRPRSTLAADTWTDHPICHAAKNGHANFVRKLIEYGVNINFKDLNGRSPLSLAARQGHFALVQMLISLGACQLSYDRYHRRPIANAASQGHHVIADYLLQELVNYSPVHLNYTIKVDIQWMLLYAAKEGNEKRVRSLLSKGADINYQFKDEKCTPLCGALSLAPRPLRTVKLLLDLGADPNITLPPKRTRSGGWRWPSSTPLRLAMLREESLDLIKVLVKSGADAGQSSLALFDAVALDKPAEFQLLVDRHADINVRLERKPLAECILHSTCEKIKEAFHQRDFTATTRELALHRARGQPLGRSSRRRRRNEQTADESALTELEAVS